MTWPSTSERHVIAMTPSAPIPAKYTKSPEMDGDIGAEPSPPVGARLHQMSLASLPASSRQTASQPKLVTTFLPETATSPPPWLGR